MFSEISSFTGGEAFQNGPFRVTVLFVILEKIKPPQMKRQQW
jgi:hypothetical protein